MQSQLSLQAAQHFEISATHVQNNTHTHPHKNKPQQALTYTNNAIAQPLDRIAAEREEKNRTIAQRNTENFFEFRILSSLPVPTDALQCVECCVPTTHPKPISAVIEYNHKHTHNHTNTHTYKTNNALK